MTKDLKRHRPQPRISVNDMARFMVSQDTGRIGILRRAKFPKSAAVIRYRDARDAARAFLTDPLRRISGLVAAESMLQQRLEDPSSTHFWQEDARLSIEAVHALQRMKNTLAPYVFVSPPQEQEKLIIEAVEISVWADLIVHGVSRGKDQIGAAILRLTQDDSETDAAKVRRKEIGFYVATMARMHVD